MKIFDRFEVMGNYPALYDPVEKMLIISDLHLGLESLMADSGMFMPKFQLSELKDDLSNMTRKKDVEGLIVCGDIKHEFSETSYGEKKEVEEFIEFSVERVDRIYLVKGNHDNYLIYPTKKYSNVELEDSFVFGDTCFIHGHEKVERIRGLDIDYLIMGHEHPALTLSDDIGVKEKIRCFLYGEMKNGTRLIVMPAFSELAQGSQMNRIGPDQILSPILKDMVDIREMKAIGVDKEAGLFEFPRLKEF
ncbi:MAG: metallophosphoesterase [Candidatus Thermoplasmatota archaeon]|nr:metallophosphoesterase [Candidatus Thermoplasmatota archaeon]